jgi:hypothetical protein
MKKNKSTNIINIIIQIPTVRKNTQVPTSLQIIIKIKIPTNNTYTKNIMCRKLIC